MHINDVQEGSFARMARLHNQFVREWCKQIYEHFVLYLNEQLQYVSGKVKGSNFVFRFPTDPAKPLRGDVLADLIRKARGKSRTP